MNKPSTLFPDCVLPGCSNPVDQVGGACRECRVAFGDYVTFNPDLPGMTEQRIEKRDRDVRAIYAARRAGDVR